MEEICRGLERLRRGLSEHPPSDSSTSSSSSAEQLVEDIVERAERRYNLRAKIQPVTTPVPKEIVPDGEEEIRWRMVSDDMPLPPHPEVRVDKEVRAADEKHNSRHLTLHYPEELAIVLL